MSVIEKLIFQAFGLWKILFSIKNGHFINVFTVKIPKNDQLKYKKPILQKKWIFIKIFHSHFVMKNDVFSRKFQVKFVQQVPEILRNVG